MNPLAGIIGIPAHIWKRGRARLSIELGHYRTLPPNARSMIVSYIFFLTAYPILATFMNAYLWRSNGNLWAIIIYNAGYVVGLPLGFYLNGYLLGSVNVLRLYFTGALLQALTPIFVVFLPPGSVSGLLEYGVLYGIGAGIFWGNKNYLDLQITRAANRMYYNSIGQIFDHLANVIVPAAAGWFIVFGRNDSLDPGFTAYKILMGIGCLLLILSGLAVQKADIPHIVFKGLAVHKTGYAWTVMRVYNILFNIMIGTTLVLPNVLILLKVGNEGVLGTVQAAASMLSVVALYIIGRKSTISNAPVFIFFGSVAYLVLTAVLTVSFSWIGVLAYSVAITAAWASQWTPSSSVAMDLMDKLEPDPEKQYAYVCDNELFYNTGRIVGIGLVTVISVAVSQHAALRFTPLLVGFLQLPLGWLALQMVREIKRRP